MGKRFNLLAWKHGDNSISMRCFILDDSLLPKSNPYSEGVSKVFDHVTKRPVWGYKFLLLAYWDGKSLIHLDFTFHRESDKDEREKVWTESKTT